MMFRAILSSAALVLVLLLCLNANAAPACDGGPCPAAKPSKPLDIMKFMREQAASTRPAEKPRRAAPKAPPAPTAKATPVPAEAASSFAAEPVPMPPPQLQQAVAPAPSVEVVTEDEFNAIDRAGEAASPETIGAAPPPMQFADVEMSTVVAKGEQPAPPVVGPQPDPTPSAEAQPSWLRRIWSAIQDTFAALAAAVHHLVG
jgi:hypothetical protein